MSGDIHIKLDESWYERWRKCGVYFGQRSALLRTMVKRLIVELENQPKVEEKILKEEKE